MLDDLAMSGYEQITGTNEATATSAAEKAEEPQQVADAERSEVHGHDAEGTRAPARVDDPGRPAERSEDWQAGTEQPGFGERIWCGTCGYSDGAVYRFLSPNPAGTK